MTTNREHGGKLLKEVRRAQEVVELAIKEIIIRTKSVEK